jgi:hypothetical protein
MKDMTNEADGEWVWSVNILNLVHGGCFQKQVIAQSEIEAMDFMREVIFDGGISHEVSVLSAIRHTQWN